MKLGHWIGLILVALVSFAADKNPATAPKSPTTTTPKTPTNAPRPGFSVQPRVALVLSAEGWKVVEKDEEFWQFSYKFTARNPSTNLVTGIARVLFKDADGYAVKQAFQMLSVEPMQSRSFTGIVPIETAEAATVQSMKIYNQ